MPLRVSAISFLNPAPLLYNFEHEPTAADYQSRYRVHYTSPARCADELQEGEADLGLIPIARLTTDLSVVPGCTIASLHEVRSILLLARCRPGEDEASVLSRLRSVAADSASRSSAAYLQTVLRRFYGADPMLHEHAADPVPMLRHHDAALLIGDPALVAREQKARIGQLFQAETGEDLLWLDLATLWHRHTDLPWVAAVWAIRPEALGNGNVSAGQLLKDLHASRDAGLAHTEDLVTEWLPRVQLPAATIRTYLTRNIHYHLDDRCIQGAETFRRLASETGVLPPLPHLTMLHP